MTRPAAPDRRLDTVGELLRTVVNWPPITCRWAGGDGEGDALTEALGLREADGLLLGLTLGDRDEDGLLLAEGL